MKVLDTQTVSIPKQEKKQEKRQTKKQMIYEVIREEITDGTYSPGEQVTELDLAERFHSSRSPIREALRQLVQDGYLEEYPNRGVFVKRYTSEELEEIYDFRSMIEDYAIRQSGSHMTAESIAELYEIKRLLAHYHQENNLSEYVRIDAMLHQKLVDLSGNKLVIDTYRRLGYMIQQFRENSLTSQQRFQDSLAEHNLIIDSVLSGNVREAERINQIHLGLAKEHVIHYLKSLEE